MAKWIMVDRDDEYFYMVNQDTGTTKKVKLASDKQIVYLQLLRDRVGKAPLKSTTMPAYEASAKIEQLKKQLLIIPPKLL